jgi:phosphoribosylamine---glycine ligase
VKLLILNLDSVGEGLAFAMRCAQAGHDVRLWLAKDANPETGDGFGKLAKVDNWLSSARWADLIVPTGNHQFMEKLDYLRRQGVKVFGPTKKSAYLEIERSRGMKFFEEHGIEVPPYEEFADLAAARAHVLKTEGRYVFKTLGDEEDKSLSYVSKSPADMIARLDRWERLGMKPDGAVMLQEVIEGVELGVSRWIGSEGFVGPYNENFEHKKLLSGNCGPNCGEAGTIMKYCARGSQLGEQVLEPLEDALVKLGHLGDIDVNCIIDEKGKAWPLEFTTRLGWPAFNIQLATTRGDPCEWMLEACEGKDTLEVSTKVACGIVLAQPDYPYSKLTQAKVTDIPVYGVSKANEKFLFAQSVKRTEMPEMEGDKLTERTIWATTGDYIMVVTGQGSTVRRAAERAYGTLKELFVPDMIYRDDIGEKLAEELPKLHAHGFATEFAYE